ncbi:TldD/PmbA family protein [Roseospirillum parvum]|uniref:PmbA protein n=1 Tax=Roseospirillum parvum TaxID=83401 RepID=A0A1G7UVN6_9PROT|nr:metallopeptidase TldD-related protein [Roseospirillum parvum]SDG51665.1 PmbA protein [Roseospirillum parvum]
MTPTDPAALDLLDHLVGLARRAGADAADALLADGTALSVGWRLGNLERLERAEGGDIGLRVLVGRRQAIVATAERAPEALREVAERAVAMARAVPEDPHCGLADPDQLAHDLPEIDQFDPTEPSPEDLLEQVRAAEDTARAHPAVTNSEGAEAEWSQATVSLVATNGLARQYRRSTSGLSVAVLAGGDGAMERDYAYTSAVHRGDLKSAEEIGREAAERASRRLGGRQVGTAQVPLLFEPRVARGLLGHLLGAINGASIARGTSFLADQLGQAVMAPGITVREEPHRHRGLRSRPCDAEGLPTRARDLIADGVLTTWLLDLRTARQLGLQSTGHAVRGSASAPSPGVSNVHLVAGAESPQAMIAAIDKGVLVSELFGHGINPVTGDYSRGMAGFWIENGEITHPVNEMTIAGNLKDMLRHLIPANDLTLDHATNSPTVRVDGMTIAGS